MNINELYNTYYSLESYINELESQLIVDLALEGYSYEDIATESIGSKIKEAFAKIRKGNKSEGERELKEVTDELKEEEVSAETPEEKKRLSTKKKVAIAAAIAAMTAAAIALAKSKNNKDRQKAEVIQKQVKAVSKIVSNKAPHVKAVSKTVSNKAPEDIKTNDVSKTISMAKNTVLLLEKPKEQKVDQKTKSKYKTFSGDPTKREKTINTYTNTLKEELDYKNKFKEIDSSTYNSHLKKYDKLIKHRTYLQKQIKKESDPTKKTQYENALKNINKNIASLKKAKSREFNKYQDTPQKSNPKRVQELQEKSKMIVRRRDEINDKYRHGKMNDRDYERAINSIDSALVRINNMIKNYK